MWQVRPLKRSWIQNKSFSYIQRTLDTKKSQTAWRVCKHKILQRFNKSMTEHGIAYSGRLWTWKCKNNKRTNLQKFDDLIVMLMEACEPPDAFHKTSTNNVYAKSMID